MCFGLSPGDNARRNYVMRACRLRKKAARSYFEIVQHPQLQNKPRGLGKATPEFLLYKSVFVWRGRPTHQKHVVKLSVLHWSALRVQQ